jgi:hypothetical protein
VKPGSFDNRPILESGARERLDGPAGQSLDLRGMRSWGRTVRGYLLLPHLAPVLVVELATAAFAIIAWGGVPPAQLLGSLLLAMLGGQLAIGATNELIDLPFDTVGKPWKPLPSGDVSIRGARAMVIVGAIMMVTFGWRFGILAFALLAAGTTLGIAYDLWFKRTVWSWLPYLLVAALPAGGTGNSRRAFRPGAPGRGDRSGGRPANRYQSPRSTTHLRCRLGDDSLRAGDGLACRLVARH